MADEQKVFVPARPLEPGDRYDVLSGFEPGIRTLPAGFRIAPPFRSLPVDLWEHKIPRFDQITVPAYVVASYSNTLHTAGSFAPEGADNGWKQTPHVRYAVLDLEGGDRINQPARAFPPEDVTSTKSAP